MPKKPKSNTVLTGSFTDHAGDVLKTHRPLRSDGRSFEQAAAFIRNSGTEHVYFFKDGKQIARFRGESGYVNPPEEALLRMKDCEVLHNHPEGTSFSVEDVKAVIRYDAAKLTVITSDSLYAVVRPKDGWKIDMENEITKAILEESISLVQDDLRKMEMRGQIFSSEKRKLENHYIWRVFFAYFEVVYENQGYPSER